MSKHFPIFIDLEDKKITLVGGGNIAERRAAALADFGPRLTVLAPEVTEKLAAMASEGRITWIKEEYTRERILDSDMVLACTDHPGLNHEIYVACRCMGIYVNNCSNHKQCDFFFPALAVDGDLVVGISGNGRDHKEVKEARICIEEALKGRKG